MGIGIINAGLSGVKAAQAGLASTGNNISNATTPGYNRQVVVQSAMDPIGTGFGFIGQGTEVTSIRRLYSQFLDNQVLSAQSSSSQLSAHYEQIKQIDNMLADTNSGISPTLQDFFNAVQVAANNPADATARQGLVSAGNALTARFNAMDQRLGQMADGVNSQLRDSVSSINAYSQQIAQMNQKIVVAQSGAAGQPANDLLDQRDALIADLNKLVKTTVIQQTDGTSNVFIGSGQPLVMNATAFSLTTLRSPTDPMRLEVAMASAGSPTELPESGIQGGSLGGILAFRSQSLDTVRNSIGRIAMALAEAVNNQHQLGMDATGAMGGAFFTINGPQVTNATTNTGNATVTAAISSTAALTTSDYRLAYDGSNYTLTRVSDGTQQSFATFPQTVDGVSINLASGSAQAGDQFLIQPTVSGAGTIHMAIGDPKRVALAAPIRTAQAASNTGNAVITPGVVNGPPPINANLQQPVTITFTGAGQYNVSGTGTGNPSGVAYAAGGNISYNGWTVQISGTPAAGDTFTIVPNASGVADNRNALLIGRLQTGTPLDNGTMSYQSAYANLVGNVGNTTQELKVTSSAQSALLTQSTTAREAFSGVNLDEEAANLMKYQQAYQASAKVIAMAGKLFESILQLG